MMTIRSCEPRRTQGKTVDCSLKLWKKASRRIALLSTAAFVLQTGYFSASSRPRVPRR